MRGIDQNHEVSIHAPRVGGDPGFVAMAKAQIAFQSTPPAWGATSPHLDMTT